MCTVAETNANLTGATAAGELRVLLVDDHDDMLSMMNLLLSKRSYAVATANSAHQALQLAPGFAPHVVVSDIGMPDMDGYEMMAKLRGMQALSPFRSIALSGFGMAGDRERSLAAGYDVHLTKPVDFDDLCDLVHNLANDAIVS